MATQTEICNRALIRIGADTIVDITENSKEGRLCNILYDQIRKDLLRSHPWNFAIRRIILAPDANTAPDTDFFYYLPLPTDCLRILVVNNNQIDYKVESFEGGGVNLVCNEDAPEVIYIADIEDTSLFDPLFSTLFSLRLAIELSYNLANSASITQLLMQEYRLASAQAKLFDAQEGMPSNFENYTWIDWRLF